MPFATKITELSWQTLAKKANRLLPLKVKKLMQIKNSWYSWIVPSDRKSRESPIFSQLPTPLQVTLTLAFERNISREWMLGIFLCWHVCLFLRDSLKNTLIIINLNKNDFITEEWWSMNGKKRIANFTSLQARNKLQRKSSSDHPPESPDEFTCKSGPPRIDKWARNPLIMS